METPASGAETPPEETSLFISPHLDDAVFACGRLLASLAGEAVVATVFAGRPHPAAGLSEWDRAAGFAAGEDVIGRRRDEDRRALAGLAAWPYWLDFRDRQYGASPEAEQVAAGLWKVMMECAPASVFFPLGLFHSDHGLTRQAALAILRHCSSCRWFAYEDAIYRQIPGLPEAALAELRQAGYRLQAVRFREAAEASERKRQAVACYGSQIAALNSPGRPGIAGLAEPEAYWRIEAPAR